MDIRLSKLLPDAVRRGYLRQFATAVAVILVVLLVALGGVYAAERKAQSESVRETLHTNTERNAETVETWHKQYTSTTRIVSTSEQLRVSARSRSGLETTLASLSMSMPDAVQGIHLVNWRNGTVVASSEGTTSAAAGDWLETAHVDRTNTASVSTSDAYRVDNDTRIAFVSSTSYGIRYAIAVEVSLDESFEFRDPVPGSRTRVVHRNATIAYANAPDLIGTTYEGPGGGPIANHTEYVPALHGINVEQTNNSATVVERDGRLVSYALVSGTNMAVLTETTTAAAYGVAAQTRLYLGLVFLFVAVSLGAVGLLIERPVSRSISRLAERAEAIEGGDLDVDLETDRRDEIGTLYRTFGSMRDSLADRIDEVERAREEARAEADEARREAERAREEAEEFTAHLERTADDYGETIRACADGDLTRRLDPDDESDAMAEIARAFNQTMADLEETIARVRDFADDVAESTTTAASAARGVRADSGEMSDDVAEIAADATEQDEYLQEVAEEMNDLSATVEEVAATTDTVADLAGETESVASDGATAAGEAMAEMETIESATAETAAEIRTLDEEVDRVADIVDLIDDIADQTNTLALNASIEAARADGDGDGFAVVADEVKALAEQTREATREIDGLLTGLSERTGEAVADIESMRDDVVDGVETTERALDALDEVATKVEQTNDGVQEISDAADDQADSAQAVVSLADRAADISDETASRAEAVAATASAQVDSLDEVADTARTIESRAGELSDLLDEFTVDADAIGGSEDPDDPAGDADSTDALDAPGSIDPTLAAPDEDEIDADD